ncbi:uncharacterized protein LOC132726360 [Ruditapes philippinarum]|uniref:uncharacterized protein LOC132726360 n=1 Tax=Ruditapes philippinarum TaxID=129788 RepID=UPI00295BC103|nr:uncharacterized protein LOC132726360 [Ruditapes philippinarum]
MGLTAPVDCLDGFSIHCGTNPCLNSGTCMVVRHEYSCDCAAGFTGRNCDSPVTSCDVGPCLNGGQCTPFSLTDYNCTCPAPFSGKNCQIDIDHCTSTSCINNGTCIDQKGSSLCACSSHSGYFGSSCQFPQDPCLRFPCNNSGICITQGSYNRVCNCPDGFSGVNCEYNLDECDPNPCSNGAACIDGDNSFTCVCLTGFKGTYCEQRNRADTCSQVACSAGRGCIDNYITNTRYCLCNEGWYFDDSFKVCRVNTKYCENYDCGTDGQCITYDGGYHLTCHCNVGYGGNTCQLNIDDCAYHPCKNNATCSDSVNDFSCTCTKAGSGGKTCDDNLNGCSSCLSANTDSCTDTLDGYTCYCKDGFQGTNCEVNNHISENPPLIPRPTWGFSDKPVRPGLRKTCSIIDGEFCETIKNNCITGQECKDGGQCISTSTGYVCNCAHGYTGTRCEERYDLCEISKPCVGDGNGCDDTPDGVNCNCDQAYTGASCETLLWYCADDTCKNNGTCSITNTGVNCTCIPGFRGNDCSINIDECLTITCPQNSVCQDGINSAKCVCLDDKVGENCQKDSSDDFDYIVLPPGGCHEDKIPASFSFTASAFTVAFWVRLTVLNDPDAMVTIFGVQKSGDSINEWTYRVRVNGKSVRFDMSRGQSSIELPIENNDIEDGLWHHVAVSWNGDNGYLTLYLNGVYQLEDFFAVGQSLTDWGYVLLGSESSTSNSFIGRISKLKLYNEKLEDEAIADLFDNKPISGAISVLPQELLKILHSVDYNSQLFHQICTSHTSCPDRAFQGSAFPQVQSCPRDIHVVNSSRISRPLWDDSSVTFLQTNSDTRTTNAIPGETDIDWGVHGIGIVEYSSDRHAAVCMFRLFKTNKECYDPSIPADLLHDCADASYGEGRRCKISCRQSGYSVSQEITKYYTCSKYGMWDGNDKTGVFFYPSCAPVWEGSNNLIVHVEYTLVNCQLQKAVLLSNLRSRIVEMNSHWRLGMCKTDQGGNDDNCDTVEISVDCISNSEASVNVTFTNTPATVSDGTNTVSLEGAFKISAIDEMMFSFAPDVLPVLSSYVVESTMTCPPGSHLLETECVKCGSGTYYDSTSSRCIRCPKGTYRTVGASTPILSSCTSCSGSDTTTNTGSPDSGYCHSSCFFGKFYNSSSRACESCPVGLFNDVIGSSYCTPCAITDTTLSEGSVESGSCLSFASLTTTTTVSTLPATGESKEGSSLSAGVIAAIVISVLIALLIIAICVFLCLTKRLPCFAKEKKIAPTGAPYKHVYKYGETNMKYLNYRLSDLRENKEKTIDKMPIYPEPRTPDDSVSIRDDISIQVPVFMEKLNGTVHKKHTYISNGRASEVGSELDHTIEKPVSERAFSVLSESTRFTGKENGRSMPDFTVTAPVTPTPPRSRRKNGGSRRGRPPAQLSQYESPQIRPRALTPIHNRQPAPEIQMTSEYIRPLPSFSRQRADVTPYQYQDFLESGTPTTSQFGSDKILLDSDDEDLR